MTKAICMASVMFLANALTVGADEPATKIEPTKATYVISGLHCPPCTKTVETSLQKAKGVRSVKVDWTSKLATVEFDESVLPAQALAQAITDTPHLMGGNLKYGGALSLKVPDLKDEATGKKATEALSKVAGVTTAKADPAQHTVAIEFSNQGKVTSRQLIDALAAAGLKASN